MNIPIPKTASLNNIAVKNLCNKLVPNGQPVELQVEATAHSIELDCMENVSKQIKKQGGSIQYGWQIWETLPGVMIEAEFHAVWVDEKNELHDITPKQIPGINRILFLPDESLKYEGKQIDNIRIPLKDDQLIRDFIGAAEKYIEIINKGELADYHGPLNPTREMLEIMIKKDELVLQILQKYYSYN